MKEKQASKATVKKEVEAPVCRAFVVFDRVKNKEQARVTGRVGVLKRGNPTHLDDPGNRNGASIGCQAPCS